LPGDHKVEFNLHRRLLIAGAGSPDLIRIIDAINEAGRDTIDVVGFLDDDPFKEGGSFMGYRILGSAARVWGQYRDCGVVNNVARDMCIRWKVFCALQQLGVTDFPSLVHPAVQTRCVEIGPGCLINEGCILGFGARIGAHSIIGVGATVGHEATVGECAFVATGAILGARSVAEAGAFLGLNCTVIPSVRIGESAFVGAGAVVTADVPPLTKVFGNPARVFGTGPHYRTGSSN
jgi:sugar O-acyltransferase (sialic acid O-acetyltransferase NeuD family)